MIVKVGPDRYVVKSSTGKRLSKPMPLAGAKARLAQVEMFKAMRAKK